MDAGTILSKLEQTIDDERAAIRRLDRAQVEACAAAKMELVAKLVALDARRQVALSPRLKPLLGRLRQNGVLLAHARSILSDVLRAKAAAMNPPTTSRTAGAPAGVRLSVRG